MDRYQPYLIAASVLMMAGWLLRSLRSQGQRPDGDGRGGAVVAVRALGRQLVPMGVMYAGTLVVTMAVSQLLEAG